jgi:hypothetical protein
VTGLVEILPGLWLRREQVAAVMAFPGETKMTVRLTFIHNAEASVSWDFDGWNAALAWAAKLAAAVNEAS